MIHDLGFHGKQFPFNSRKFVIKFNPSGLWIFNFLIKFSAYRNLHQFRNALVYLYIFSDTFHEKPKNSFRTYIIWSLTFDFSYLFYILKVLKSIFYQKNIAASSNHSLFFLFYFFKRHFLYYEYFSFLYKENITQLHIS